MTIVDDDLLINRFEMLKSDLKIKSHKFDNI